MADFYTGLTGTVQLDDVRVTKELVAQFILAYRQVNVMDALAEWRYEEKAKSVSFARYPQLTGSTTALNEREEVDSEQMSDSAITFTPKEYGNVISLTNLTVLQSGGRDALAAVQLIGQDMANTRNKLAIAAVEASSNSTDKNGANITDAFINAQYNKLARANVPKHMATNTYIAIAHDDVLHDIRAGSAANTWVDVNKYNNEVPVLMNEVGMYRGFRWITNNDCKLTVNGGGSPAEPDDYTTSFIGYNAFGLAESELTSIRITGPFDKLGRFYNVGWYGVFEYKLIEPASTQLLLTGSSVATNPGT